jgi:hypothetical protein
MSHDQKPARIRLIGSAASNSGRLRGGFATGPAPRRPATPRPIGKPGLSRAVIAVLFLSAALIGGVVQAWLVLRA